MSVTTPSLNVGAHTPGPWRAARYGADARREGIGWGAIVTGPNKSGVRDTVARIFSDTISNGGDRAAEANARLIAAAPTLLAALETTAGNIRSLRDAGLPGPLAEWARVVDEAIALAKSGPTP